MSNRAPEATLATIHEKMAMRMLTYLENLETNPEATFDPRMANAIIKFLKDNNIAALAGTGNGPMEKLRAIAGGRAPVLPFSPVYASGDSE